MRVIRTVTLLAGVVLLVSGIGRELPGTEIISAFLEEEPYRIACDGCCDALPDCCSSLRSREGLCDRGNLLGLCDPFGDHRHCYPKEKRRSLADKHAPAGLMGDHVHHQGEWMVEYKYMNMYMQGNRQGTTDIPTAATFDITINGATTNMHATPLNMTMEMHMLHIMYGWSDDVTLYIMPMWSSLTMDHQRDTPFGPNPMLSGTTFTTHNNGFDDMVLGALWRIYEGCTDELIVNLAFSVPTGDINRTTTVPLGTGMAVPYPYPMRIGSGTVDGRPAVTYKSYYDHGSLGIQYAADLTIGQNSRDYAVGDEHRLNAWYTWLPCDNLALSYRVENLWRNNFDGADPMANQGFISTNRPDMRGGHWVNFGYGGALLVGKGHLFSFEAVHPVYQNLEGIQLKSDWWFNASWSKAF